MNWPAPVWYLRLNTGEPPFDQSVEGVVKQRLLDGYLPIVINSWETDGVRYEQTCVATFLAGEPAEIKGDETVVLLSRLVMTNTTSAAARAVVRLRTEPGERLETDHGHVSATALRGEKVEPYPEPRYRFFVLGDGSETQSDNPTTDSQATTVSSDWRLAPGEARSFQFRVPFVTIDTEAERRQIAALDFDRVLAAEAERWRKIIVAGGDL